MIFCLRQLQEKAVEQRKKLYIVFFDFRKAFDSVNRKMLWKFLEKFGCPRKLLRIVRAFHEGMKGKISISGETSEDFVINNGVKQGDPLAPTLFTLFLTAVLEQMGENLLRGVYVRTRADGKLFNFG